VTSGSVPSFLVSLLRFLKSTQSRGVPVFLLGEKDRAPAGDWMIRMKPLPEYHRGTTKETELWCQRADRCGCVEVSGHSRGEFLLIKLAMRGMS